MFICVIILECAVQNNVTIFLILDGFIVTCFGLTKNHLKGNYYLIGIMLFHIVPLFGWDTNLIKITRIIHNKQKLLV